MAGQQRHPGGGIPSSPPLVNPIQGALVTFSDGGKGGSFSSPSVTTDALGHAATSYTTPAVAGTVRITVTSGGLKPANFTVTVTAAN